ncbi:SpoIIE family protein phosphatase [Streptomyces hoynatensis]|nr:SpoIIE family protein phosphatase [Streptomyces hoynatensis]
MDRPAGVVVPAADAASAVVDARGVVRAWSPGAARLLGHQAQEVVGRSAAGLVAQDVHSLAARCAGERCGWHGWLALRHRDGAVVPAEVRAYPAEDGGGTTTWLLHAGVTQSSADYHRLLEWAIDQSASSLGIYDVDARVRFVNATVLRDLGVTREDSIGRHLEEIFRDSEAIRTEAGLTDGEFEESVRSLAEVSELIREVARRNEPRRQEVSGPRAGTPGHVTWSLEISPIRDPGGQVRGVFVAATDVTEQSLARQRLNLLNTAGDRIGSTLDVNRTAQELAATLVPELCDFATIDLLPEVAGGGEPPAVAPGGTITLRRAAHQSIHDGIPESVVPVGQLDTYPDYSPPARCLVTGRPFVDDLPSPSFERWIDEDPERRERARVYGYHSIMTVPLRARGTVLGTALMLRSRQDSFVRDDVLLAGELCARAAVSVDNARRYARERGTALALQRSLLPQQLHGQVAVYVASRYLPAGGRAGVGGDWFDVIPLSGTRVALVIGDVVGHGLHASATMGRLRTAVRTLADVDLPPDELLTHLDDLVSHLAEQEGVDEPGQDPTGEIGATCLYAVYDPVSRQCVMASAGHAPPVIVTPGGAATGVGLSPGPPLGVGGLPFESVSLELPVGSLIALYTNGLIDPKNREFDEGQHLLREVLAQPSDSLGTTCDRVLRTLLPERQVDDAALLLARTRALDAEHVATIDLDQDPALVASARKAAGEQLVAWHLPEAAFITELVVSELVTNAIKHASPPIRLRLIRGETSLICEVSDGSSTAPHLRRARTFDEGGRGLLLVAQLSQQWGTRQTPTGKTIWAEQQLPGG